MTDSFDSIEAATFFKLLKAVRVPTIISIITAALIAIPDQSIEIFRMIAQDISYGMEFTKHVGFLSVAEKFREFILMIVGLMGLALIFWYTAHITLIRHFNTSVSVGFVSRTFQVFLLPLIAVIPIWASAVGFFRARAIEPSAVLNDALSFELQQQFAMPDEVWSVIKDDVISGLLRYNSFELSMLLASVGAVMFLTLFLVEISDSSRRWIRYDFFSNQKVRWGISAVIAASVILLILYPIELPNLAGVVLVLCMFGIYSTLVFGQLAYWSNQTGIPWLSGIFVFAAIIALMGVNDNHRVRVVPVEPLSDQVRYSPIPPTRLSEEFELWYKSRVDKNRYSGGRYPIYVVAAQGGGIYAAYHTATVLGSLVDNCPYFAHHLFAISGVSGGSIGAAAFAAVTSQGIETKLSSAGAQPCLVQNGKDQVTSHPLTHQSFAQIGTSILDGDFLAPLVAGLLFPDFIQRFIPYPFSILDRARYLEIAIETAWDNKLSALQKIDKSPWLGKRNILSDPYLNHWDPAGSSPALIFNMTEVESGRRRVVTPFIFASDNRLRVLPVWDDVWAQDLGSETLVRRLPLSTAAVLSARFPWLTPAAWFDDVRFGAETRDPIRDSETGKPLLTKVQLVDGGYFDNSGVLTATDLIRSMDKVAADLSLTDKIQINLIVLSRDIDLAQRSGYTTGSAAPVKALLNARVAQGQIIVEEAANILSSNSSSDNPVAGGARHRLQKVSLNDIGYELPLGWRLSEVARLLIFAQRGRGGRCANAENRRSSQQISFDSDCLATKIRRDLELSSGAE